MNRKQCSGKSKILSLSALAQFNLQFLQQSNISKRKLMRKIPKEGQSQEQFDNFLKNVIDVQKIYIRSCQAFNKKIQSSTNRDKNTKFLQLQKECEENERKIVVLNAQLSCFKKKTMLLLQKCHSFEECLTKIMSSIKKHMNKVEFSFQNESSISTGDIDEINIKNYQQMILEYLKKIYEQQISRLNNVEKVRELDININQINERLEALQKKNKELSKQNQNNMKLADKYKQISINLQRQLSQTKVQIKKIEQEQAKYAQLIKDLDIKTKNRADMILLFKGLAKKQRQHETRCPLYRNQEQILNAQELENYQRERKQKHAETKKQLKNVLNFV